MPDVTNFTDPLNGFEPIEYVVGEVRKFLRRDCSLRREDGYSGGFQGRITIELDCFAVRTVHVAMEVPINIPPAVKASIDALPAEQVEEIHVSETIQIPRDENLNAVRAHIKENSAEALDVGAQDADENAPQEVAPSVMTQKRKYVGAALAGAVSGE